MPNDRSRGGKETASGSGGLAGGTDVRARKPYLVPAICGFLIVAVAVVFGRTVQHGFVNYDDAVYVYENPQVASGLTSQSIPWAFRSYRSNWHPLTWLSHMLDCQLYGLKHPGGHHLTNIALHAVSTVLLFLVLLKMTSQVWPSAFVAALFAIHPLHVESVAWVAERKDVLSGLFFMLTLGAYVGYVRRTFSLFRYLLVVVLFALGLMCKPTLVTLPFVLLLLDYWPLGRFVPPAANDAGAGKRRWRLMTALRLLAEKIPLFLLAAASSVVTYIVQEPARIVMESTPLHVRIANAVVSYVTYLAQFLWPTGLAVFYPYPKDVPSVWKIVGACLVLVGITVAVLVWRQRRPYLLVGWLWYLGMLVPMIGLVQVGNQAMADRYTYLTQIGLYLALAWGAMSVAEMLPARRWKFAAAPLLIAVLGACACQQASYWKDGETLWTHTLECTSENCIAHNDLGNALLEREQADAASERKQIDAAIAQYEKALEIEPDFALAHSNLGNALARRGDVDAAIAHLQKALEIDPDLAIAHNNLGNALVHRGDVNTAVVHFERALEIKSDYAEAHNNLGLALFGRKEVGAAIAQYEKALEINPQSAKAHNNLANALMSRGETAAAIAHYEKALEIKPDFAEAHNNLGNALARRGDADAAISHFQKALEIKPDFAMAHYSLANALFRRGEVDAAIAHYKKAVEIKPDFAAARRNLNAVLAERRER